MTREEVLREAYNIISGDRDRQYGNPEDNFKVIANLWGTYLGTIISPHEVAIMMILLKVARLSSGETKADNWIDIAGYSACGAELQLDKELRC